MAKSWPSKNQSEPFIYFKPTLPCDNINHHQTHTWMRAATCRTKPILMWSLIDHILIKRGQKVKLYSDTNQSLPVDQLDS